MTEVYELEDTAEGKSETAQRPHYPADDIDVSNIEITNVNLVLIKNSRPTMGVCYVDLNGVLRLSNILVYNGENRVVVKFPMNEKGNKPIFFPLNSELRYKIYDACAQAFSNKIRMANIVNH